MTDIYCTANKEKCSTEGWVNILKKTLGSQNNHSKTHLKRTAVAGRRAADEFHGGDGSSSSGEAVRETENEREMKANIEVENQREA